VKAALLPLPIMRCSDPLEGGFELKRLIMLVLIAGLFAAGCASKSSGSLGAAPSGSPPSSTPSQTPSVTPSETPSGSPSVSPIPPPTGGPFTFEVWFMRDGKLFVTSRTEPFVPAVARLALDALLVGPNSAEMAAGVASAIPSGSTAVITAPISNGLAVVDLSVAGPPGDGEELRTAQFVYTLTQYSTISKVRFVGDSKTYSRQSLEDLLPPILVETPLIGQSVSSPVTISGTANVFEATVSIRILDEDGNELANTFTTATCGTGCRGDYSIAVRYSVNHQQRGTVEVFESSAQDGSAINVQSIPVTLTP
jgi:immunoglobulin-like protein involved in spore germination/sporulation and spore germination protein